jgi:hypothetical protein
MLITYLIVIIAMALNSMPSLFILKLTSAEVHSANAGMTAAFSRLLKFEQVD